jgi:hypothetical protein
MKPAIDLTGKQFGYWTVLHRGHTVIHSTGSIVFWTCRCVCGLEKDVPGGHLRRSHKPSKSCGCMQRELCSNAKTRHGHARHRTKSITGTYWSWQAMNARVRNPSSTSFKNYGGRGITICERWELFENFLADMGSRPDGLSLDRYPNPDGNYEPGNCRWATRQEQQKNKKPRTKSNLKLSPEKQGAFQF